LKQPSSQCLLPASSHPRHSLSQPNAPPPHPTPTAHTATGEKGRRIRELTSVVQKRFAFPPDTVELYAEKVANRGLCAVAQAESLRYKLLGGLAVRRCAVGRLCWMVGVVRCGAVWCGAGWCAGWCGVACAGGRVSSGSSSVLWPRWWQQHGLSFSCSLSRPLSSQTPPLTPTQPTHPTTRACYGVLRFVMESGAKGCEVIVSGKLRAARAPRA